MWVFWVGFLGGCTVYPKKPTGFFGYVPGCLNPGQYATEITQLEKYGDIEEALG